jgi:hypothetical protein
VHDYGNLARDHGPTTVTDQNEALVGAAVASPLAVGERLVNFFNELANDLLDWSRSRQNGRKDVNILGSLLERLRNPLHVFWGAMGAMQHNGQFSPASPFGQLGLHQFAPARSNAGNVCEHTGFRHFG